MMFRCPGRRMCGHGVAWSPRHTSARRMSARLMTSAAAPRAAFLPLRALCCLAVLTAVLCQAVPGHARRAEAVWGDGQVSKTRAQAQGEAFTSAVTDEALDILRAPLSEARRAALREYLATVTGEVVRGYTELGMTQVQGGTRLAVDVDVNRDMLKERLRQVGAYYTAEEPVGMVLQLSGASPEVAERVSKLQLLYGVEQRAGAAVRVALRPQSKAWYGTLDAPEGSTSADGASADDVWRGLWAWYFSHRQVAGAAAGQQAVLRVSGWLTADSVESFDRALHDWDRALQSVQLQDVTMRPGGLVATWKLVLVNRVELDRRLDEYLAPRKLTREVLP